MLKCINAFYIYYCIYESKQEKIIIIIDIEAFKYIYEIIDGHVNLSGCGCPNANSERCEMSDIMF